MSGEDTAWYRQWFGDTYLELYPHRDEQEAREGVRLLRDRGGVEEGARVLDLACGDGRHCEALRRDGLRPVGLDLSRPLLAHARRRLGRDVPLVRGDMRRLPFRAAVFDAVVQFFTSFGYFERRRDDRRVLEEVRRVLGPGGRFLLDFLHAAHVRRTLVPRDERVLDGRRVVQERWIEGDRVVKRIEIHGEEPGPDAGPGEAGPGETAPEEVYHERVRLYGPEELAVMLEQAGLEVDGWAGDYGGGRFGPDAPRLILLGRAP